MKTIVISGGSSGVGKTTLADELVGLLPRSVHVKVGHHKADPDRKNIFFPMGTTLAEIAQTTGRARFAVIESNSILRAITPDCTIYLPSENPKPSAALAISKAQIIRGERVKPATITSLTRSLDIQEQRVRQMIWLSGARPSPATAVILAGGKSSRMGLDKAMLDIHGEPLINRTINRLSPWFDHVIVSSRAINVKGTGVRRVADRHIEKGPLAGIAAALQASTTDHNFVVACDIPCINMLVTFKLLSELEDADTSVLSLGPGRLEPLFACYRKGVSEIATGLIREGKLRVSGLFDCCETRIVRTTEKNWYTNMNTPREYQHFLAKRTAASLPV